MKRETKYKQILIAQTPMSKTGSKPAHPSTFRLIVLPLWALTRFHAHASPVLPSPCVSEEFWSRTCSIYNYMPSLLKTKTHRRRTPLELEKAVQVTTVYSYGLAMKT